MRLNNSLKFLLGFFATVFTTITFFSCYKEYSVDRKNSSPFAQGTLKDSSGECLHDSAIGTYYSNVKPGADTNYIELKLNITHAGTYNISTDEQNGLRFADSGYVYHKGDTVIHLKPIGIPLATEATFFTLSFNEDVCYCFVHVQ
jgi:hypothetical protein